MRSGRWQLVVVLVMAISSSPAWAQNTTPGNDRAITAQFMQWQFGNDGAIVQFLAPSLGYHLDYLGNPVQSNTPTVTIPMFGNMLREGYGWNFISSHGNTGSFMVEPYLAAAQRDANLAQYIVQGYSADELFASQSGTVPGISVTAQFISPRFSSDRSLVHVSACNSASLAGAFIGKLAFIGYDYSCRADTSTMDSRQLYSNMAGWNGVTKRPLNQAYLGTTLASPVGSGNVVLAPIVTATNLVPGATVSQPTTCYLKFDCPMYTYAAPTSFILTSGALLITGASWQGNDQLSVSFKGRWKGLGTIYVVTDTSSQASGGAVSYPGYINLVGNRNGGVPAKNGYAPCGNYEVQQNSAMGGDNPAASVSGFTARRAADGIRLEWNVELENATQAWRLERSSGWPGPFTVIGELPATGSHHYTLTDPSGSVGTVYRLVEVETDGDILRQAEEMATEPHTLDPDPVITPAQGDSINAALLAEYPTRPQTSPQQIQPIFGWLAIIPDESYRQAIQPLINFHQSQGLVAENMTLAEIGGVAGIQPFVVFAARYGLKYVVACGDASNWVEHNNPANYSNGWTYPGYAAQPQFDIFPMSANIVDPVGTQALSQTWFTRTFSTDALYTDVNGDSLPDVASGRFPARTPAELSVMGAKTIAGMTQVYPAVDTVSAWGEFRDLSGNSGVFAQQMCDSLLQAVPTSMVVRKLYHTDSNPLSYSLRQQQALRDMTAGRTIIIPFGTQSNRAKWAIWLDKTQSFSWSQASPSQILPFLLAGSCDIGDLDRAEDPTYGRPLLELAMLEPNKGPFAGVAPTRGTWQHGDFLYNQEFLKAIYVYGAASAGEADIIARLNVSAAHPGYRYQMMGMQFVGDPAVPIHGMVVRTTDVTSASVATLELGIRPNPARQVGRIHYVLPTTTNVRLSVYDIQGREMATLVNGRQSAGWHTTSWSGPETGLYLVRLQAGPETTTKKMIIVH